MSRIRIDLPEKFSFQMTIPIRSSDVNFGGHVGHDTILTLLHEARVQFLLNYGFSELNLAGTALIMADCALIYHAELFYGDLLQVEIAVGDFTKSGFTIFYRATKENKEKQQINVATAKTGMVCFDYAVRKITPVPAAFKNLFKAADII